MGICEQRNRNPYARSNSRVRWEFSVRSHSVCAKLKQGAVKIPWKLSLFCNHLVCRLLRRKPVLPLQHRKGGLKALNGCRLLSGHAMSAGAQADCSPNNI